MSPMKFRGSTVVVPLGALSFRILKRTGATRNQNILRDIDRVFEAVNSLEVCHGGSLPFWPDVWKATERIYWKVIVFGDTGIL